VRPGLGSFSSLDSNRPRFVSAAGELSLGNFDSTASALVVSA
jgi:hypothetical protein